MLVFKYVYFAIVVLHIGEPGCQMRKEPHMGELIFPDFQTKDRRYTKGGGIDDMKLAEIGITDALREAGRCTVYDTAPSEYVAPTEDGA